MPKHQCCEKSDTYLDTVGAPISEQYITLFAVLIEMVNVTNISQHAVLSAHKINHIYVAMSGYVLSVYFIGNCTNLT